MHLPSTIRAIVGAAEAEPVLIGESTANVLRLRTRDGTLYLKTCLLADGDGLRDEAERLQWLEGRLAAPRVVAFVTEGGRDFLLMTSVPGVNGVEVASDEVECAVIGLAQGLRMLHAIPSDGCPFDQSVAAQIERARQRVSAGLVDETDFDAERTGRSARDVLTEVEARRPSSEMLTLTHGDACLPNIMFERGQFAGFIDCGRFGVADPYQDLALAARSIAFNFGDKHVAAFFGHYGIVEPEAPKLAFYQLLDELF